MIARHLTIPTANDEQMKNDIEIGNCVPEDCLCSRSSLRMETGETCPAGAF